METRSLEDDKRLVLEDLLGLKVGIGNSKDYYSRRGKYGEYWSLLTNYNPQDPEQATDKMWQEIYGAMGNNLKIKYMKNLNEMVEHPVRLTLSELYYFRESSAPADIRWKALIQVLLELNKKEKG